jgi:polyribonucleotide nucleotidyltransferase
MSISSAELEGILAERLDLARREKGVIRDGIEDLEGKIRNSKKLTASAPRETEEEITAIMQKLEHTHATTSQSNAEEREFMREMDKLRQKRKAAASFLKVKTEVDDMRSRLTDLRRTQAALDDTISELHNGLRKVKIANKSGCSSADIVERKLTVETSKIARIVGKGGSNLRFMEDENCVSIEIDNIGGVVRILGTEAAIANAVESLMTIVETSIDEFPLSDEVIVCMMMDKAQRVNDIQAQYGVRLDISRAKNLCKVTGLTDSVAAAKTHILSLQSVRSDMLMEPTAIAAIIGKGGASITGLQEEFHVAINVNRERNTIEVVGLRADVAAALGRIKDIVEDNREVEEVIQLEKHVLIGCLMSGGSQNLRSIAKDIGVRVDTEVVKDSPLQSIKIKGSNGKVHQAKTAIVHAVGEYVSNSLAIEVPDDVIPAILGKAGSGIKALREKYPDANIDVDGCKVHIHSADEDVRDAVKAEVDSILEANYSLLVEFDEDGKIQLRSAQGADLRNQLTKDLNVRLIIDATPTAVKVRGARADVLRAAQALEAFKQTHTKDKLVLAEEDYLLLTNSRKGAEGSLMTSFAAQYNVDIKSQRKELCLYLSGSPEGVAAAKAAVKGVLEGDAQYGSQVVELHRLVTSTLIGKGGANIAKMEGELGVKFDVLKAKEQLRIVADTPEKAVEARQAVLRFVQSCRVSDTLTTNVTATKKEVDGILRRAEDTYRVEISPAAKGADEAAKDNSNRSFTLKGVFGAVFSCKEFLAQQLVGMSTVIVPVAAHHVSALEKQTHGSLKRLQDKFNVFLALVSSPTCCVKLEGPTESVAQARQDLLKLLERYFPSEVVVLEISAACLRECFGEDYIAQLAGDGVSASVDPASASMLIVGEQDKVDAARANVALKTAQWADCRASVAVDPSLVPALVGKGGASINALRKETSATLDVNASGTCVEIKGSSREQVAAAKLALERRIRQLQAERWEHTASAELMPALIGKQGATINKLRADTGAGIDIDGSTIKVRFLSHACIISVL